MVMKKRLIACIILIISIAFCLTLVVFKFMEYRYQKNYTSSVYDENTNLENSSINEEPEIKYDKIANGTVIYPSNYEELRSYLNRNVISFLVIGSSKCHYCNLFLPILENVRTNYNLEIIYFNIAEVDIEEYKKLKESDIFIPAKCSKTGTDIPLSSGFGTPLSLMIKEGISLDCIKGYVSEDRLLAELITMNYID